MSEASKILIVEDDRDTAEAMRMSLEAQGYLVTTSADVEEGFRKAAEIVPDVVVLDVMFGMKGETKGFDYAVKMRTHPALKAVPILMVTAVNVKSPGFTFSPENDAEFLPVDGFIDKPAKPGELVQKVKDLIAQKTSKWANWPNR